MSGARIRGFGPYKPEAHNAQLVSDARAVIDEYSDFLPITLRQLFYRLTQRFGYEKSEKFYSNRLKEVMGRARRAQMIPMSALRDDGFRLSKPWWYADAAEFVSEVKGSAHHMTLDRQMGQPRRLMLWCEAGGMQPQLERVAAPFSILVGSNGGFDSITTKHEQGRVLGMGGLPVTVLHVGDHDPSGDHMFKSLDEDITAFARYYNNDIVFERIAVLPEHIEQYDLPTDTPKGTDNRSFDDTRTVQAEAFTPAELAAVVQAAIDERIDREAYERALNIEAQQREAVMNALAGLWPDDTQTEGE